jgi:hypothetical protein
MTVVLVLTELSNRSTQGVFFRTNKLHAQVDLHPNEDPIECQMGQELAAESRANLDVKR